MTHSLDRSEKLAHTCAVRHHSFAASLCALLVHCGVSHAGDGQTQLPTTAADFAAPGTPPHPYTDPDFANFYVGSECSACHGSYSTTTGMFRNWIATMMAQSARDPIWQASVAIANQDAVAAGQFCFRCHAPLAYLGDRHRTGTFDEFEVTDYDGVTCHFCHRLVNPELGPQSAVGYAENNPFDPDPDPEVLDPLAAAGLLPGPGARSNGTYVVDPADVRRGPFDDVPANAHGVPLHYSPFHTTSELCRTCHDVSNINTLRQADGSYAPDALGAPHATGQVNDMFPEQRTYSEWANSQFATVGVEYPDGRFGGNHPTGVMSTCQDCHMPDASGAGCVLLIGTEDERPDVPQHSFAGGNTWVVRAVRTQLGDKADSYGLTQSRVDTAIARNVQMLGDASDAAVEQQGSTLRVRITNQSGHKLPTGIGEGRRMWINLRFFDGSGALLSESGAYDFASGTLLDKSCKQYGVFMVTSGGMADAAGLPHGTTFHIALLNEVVSDNRIPPRGFTNAGYASFGGQPIGAAYADGQYWDDTDYAIPVGAATAVATVYAQTTTREYAEFLRDENVTNDLGQIAYDLWVAHGRSAPVAMDSVSLSLEPVCHPADLVCDGTINGGDLGTLLAYWGTPDGDVDGDGDTDGADLALLLGAWGASTN